MKQAYLFLIGFIFIPILGCRASSEANSKPQDSPNFLLQSEGKEIPVKQYKTYYYAHFECTSEQSLSLGSLEQIKEFEISPVSYGVNGKLDGNTLHFTISHPGYYMIRINRTHRVFIFADEIQKPEFSMISVSDYDIDATGNKLETAKLQAILDKTSGSGKVLHFPPGIYKTGLLRIRSNTNIHLDMGAIIKGPDNISDLVTKENIRPRSFILIKDAENVKITGRGIIDANGRYLRDHFGDEGRCRVLLVLNSSNISIDGIFLCDPGSWNTQILHSEDVVIRHVKVLNDIHLSNTDGINPDASRRVLIDNCFAYCSDDNIAVKSTNTMNYLQDVEDITVSNCVFLTKKSALKVGTESNAGSMKNITFENNDVLECDRGMSLYCYDGANYENIRFINNRFEKNYPDRNQCYFHFRIRQRNENSRIGIMKKVLIKDCSFLTAFPNPSSVEGFDPMHNIELVIENLTIDGVKCTNVNEDIFLQHNNADISYKE